MGTHHYVPADRFPDTLANVVADHYVATITITGTHIGTHNNICSNGNDYLADIQSDEYVWTDVHGNGDDGSIIYYSTNTRNSNIQRASVHFVFLVVVIIVVVRSS